MSSVIIGKPSIKYLQTFSQKWTASTGYIKAQVDFLTNVQELIDKAQYHLGLVASLEAGAVADFQVLDKDSNVLDSWTWDNSSGTTIMLGFYSKNFGNIVDKLPLYVKTPTVSGLVQVASVLFPRYYGKIQVQKMQTYSANAHKVGDTAGSEWKGEGLQIVAQIDGYHAWDWYYSIGGADKPVYIKLHYKHGEANTTTTTTPLYASVYRTMVFWV